jgi:hypothetical protein
LFSSTDRSTKSNRCIAKIALKIALELRKNA